MIIKTKDYYLNLDHVKQFDFKCADYNGGVSIFADGIEVFGGESIDTIEEFWRGIIKMEFEAAVVRGDGFFDLAAYLEMDQTKFMEALYEKYDSYIKKNRKVDDEK
jgi:hypothetical protein